MTTMTTLTLAAQAGPATFDAIDVPVTGGEFLPVDGVAVFPCFSVMVDTEDETLAVTLGLTVPMPSGGVTWPFGMLDRDAVDELDLDLTPAEARQMADRLSKLVFRFAPGVGRDTWSFRGRNYRDPDCEVRVSPRGVGGAAVVLVNHARRLVLGVILNDADRSRLVTALRRAVEFAEGR